MKGLRSLDHSVADVVPSHVTKASFETPREVYKAPKQLAKGRSELTREERHSAHLRKRRTQKTAKRAEENRMKVMARFDPKVKAVLDKKAVFKALADNKNVTLVGASSSASSKASGKSGKWKHNLTETLMKDQAGAPGKAKAKTPNRK